MTDPDDPADARRTQGGWLRWAPVLVVLVAWVAHSGVRNATWVLDDVRLVRDNTLVAQGPAAVPQIFMGRADEELTARYGPLTLASFALEAPLWKQSDGTLAPAGFHLTNLLLHGLCVLLLFRFLLGVMPWRPGVALAGALLVSVHPLHAGTVATLMGRSELLVVLLSLLSAFAWRAWGGRQHAWLPLAALLWLLALQASPLALGLPLLLVLLDRAAPPQGAALPALRQGAGLLVFTAPLAVFLATWGGLGSLARDLPSQPALERLAVGCEGLVRMTLAVLVPVGLRGDHTNEALPGVGFDVGATALACAALALLLTVVALIRVAKGRAGLFSGAWLGCVALAVPAFLVLPAGAALEAPFAYLTALPLFVGAGALATGLVRSGTSRRASASFVFLRGALVGALALIALIGLTQREALGWRDNEAFHERLLDRNPRHVRAMVRLARAQRAGSEALRARAAALPADHPERLGYLRQRQEALARSTAWAQRAVRHALGRRNPEAWRELGLTQLASDEAAPALRSLRRAQALDPFFARSREAQIAEPDERTRRRAAELYYAVGRCRDALGDAPEAAAAYSAATRLWPENVDMMRRAGASLCRVERYGEGLRLLLEAADRTRDQAARKEIETLIDSARRSARALATRLVAQGEVAQGEGDMRSAMKLYERAMEVNPAYARAFIRAGWLRGMWFGSYEIAETYFREAESLLRKARVPRSDADWRQLLDFRKELAKQKAEEEEGDR